MKTLGKIFTYILMVLGVVFLVQLVLVAWFWFADPLQLKPMLFQNSAATPGVTSTPTGLPATSDAHPLLNAQQETSLRAVGIDPSKLPTTITPEMEVCATSKLGATRVAEIKKGSQPTAADFFAARTCLQP